MRNVFFILIALFLSHTTWYAYADADFLLGGIQINEPDQPAWCRMLADNGLNTLHVTVYARQGVWDSDDLRVQPVDEGTVKKIRAARAAGLRVALILRLDVDHSLPENRFLWHGMVMPAPDNLHAWFDRYAQFVRQWADVAQREGVALLGLGSEMNAVTATRQVTELPQLEAYYLNQAEQDKRQEEILTSANRVPDKFVRAPGDASPSDNLQAFVADQATALYDWAAAVTFAEDGIEMNDRLSCINHRRAELLSRWRGLIAEVRDRYDGQLTYAANFDSYQDVAFWPELDAMGINAYFKLRDPTQDASLETLVAGWSGVFDEIESNQKLMDVSGMPVVFTELGYTRRSGTTTAPWAWQGFDVIGESKTLMVWETLPLAPQERVRAIMALDQVNRQRDGLVTGLLYWKLTSQPHLADLEVFSLLLQDSPNHADTDPLLGALLRFTQPGPSPSTPGTSPTQP